MISPKSLVIFASIAALIQAQEDPKPDPGKSDCKIARQGSVYFHQVVVNHEGDYQAVCEEFTTQIHSVCGNDRIQVTCPPDDDPNIMTFWYETDATCGAGQVETAIKETTGQEFAQCEIRD